MNQKNSRSLILILLTLVVCVIVVGLQLFSSVSFVSQGFEYGTIRCVGIRRSS
jgi:hypothetical protein